MNVRETDIPDVLIIEPQRFGDDRGFFLELWRCDRYAPFGIPSVFVQDNFSRSQRGVLRGLHLQNPNMQGKLVMVLTGAVLDIAVDVRRGSPTFGRYVAAELSGDNSRQLWIPRGFAHGFYVLSDYADFCYKCDAPYSRPDEKAIRWNDPAIGIAWPTDSPDLSPRDAAAPLLSEVENLPLYEEVRSARLCESS